MENLFLPFTVYFSAPEQNIRAWGKKIIKLEVHAEVRLGMNLFLFCLPLAVPTVARSDLNVLPKEIKEVGLKTFVLLFAHLFAPPARP